MKPELALLLNPKARLAVPDLAELTWFTPAVADQVGRFHRGFPNYEVTPLVSLPGMARRLGVAAIRIKDESARFGLHAFKALGASYAMADLAAELNHRPLSQWSSWFGLPEVKRKLAALTVVTATDGNHGRALAWTAKMLGSRAVVFMPRGSASARVEAIRAFGAHVEVIDGTYEQAMRLAAAKARDNGWFLVQDTTWRGDEKAAVRIMQGYMTMAVEALEQWAGPPPTHVFLQAGVGAFSGAIQAYLVTRFGAARPKVTVVEPTQAGCFYHSMIAGGVDPVTLEGEIHSVMAGLACGEPSVLAWRILRSYADAFATCDDEVSLAAMRFMAHPDAGDPTLISGESGAVTCGFLHALLSDPERRELAAELGLDTQSRVLLFSTEGATDPEYYRQVVGLG